MQNFGEHQEVDVMRVLLDHELLTLREAQKILKMNRCELEHLLRTGKLKARCIGTEWKIEASNLKRLLSNTSRQFSGDKENHHQPNIRVSPYEQAIIEEWT
ncbi:MAG: helix-turn-helix domain-containing protein [candidate division KSB1 bacterium]|nr:helix-turn-helix domain-containing protein [candidate division KSB1 bacterium]MDZ7342210.1 helix-turn-helix domain-containing protein [candidate division KSB1 bacterium]